MCFNALGLISSVYLFFHFCICLYVCVCVYVSFPPVSFLCLYVLPFLHCLYVCVYVSFPPISFLCLSVLTFLHLFVCLCVCMSHFLPFHSSVYLFFHFYICLCVSVCLILAFLTIQSSCSTIQFCITFCSKCQFSLYAIFCIFILLLSFCFCLGFSINSSRLYLSISSLTIIQLILLIL